MKCLHADQYRLTDSNSNELILVKVDLLLARLKVDSPEYFVDPDTENTSSVARIKEVVNFTKRNLYRKDYFEPVLMGSESDKIGVFDGRHRIAGAKKMGYTHLYIEVPRDKKFLFKVLV